MEMAGMAGLASAFMFVIGLMMAGGSWAFGDGSGITKGLYFAASGAAGFVLAFLMFLLSSQDQPEKR